MASAKSGKLLVDDRIWLDANIDKSADSQKIQVRFRFHRVGIKKPSSIHRLVLNHLTNENKECFLSSFQDHSAKISFLLCMIFSRILHIYVFCNNRKKTFWDGQKQHSKVSGVFCGRKMN